MLAEERQVEQRYATEVVDEDQPDQHQHGSEPDHQGAPFPRDHLVGDVTTPDVGAPGIGLKHTHRDHLHFLRTATVPHTPEAGDRTSWGEPDAR